MTPEQIRQWRAERDVTRKQLADWLGISKEAIEHWEQEWRKPPKYLYRALRDIDAHEKPKPAKESK